MLFRSEQRAVVVEGDAVVRVVAEGDEVHLETQLPDGFADAHVVTVTAADLPPVRFVDADFDDIEGRPVAFDTDLVGDAKDEGQSYPAGPLVGLKPGSQRTRVW